jgi:hypothetical protein
MLSSTLGLQVFQAVQQDHVSDLKAVNSKEQEAAARANMKLIVAFVLALFSVALADELAPRDPWIDRIIFKVTGTVFDENDDEYGQFEGRIHITSLDIRESQLIVGGIISGTVTPLQGLTQEVITDFEVPARSLEPVVSQKRQAILCNILNLDLGPIDLNLLGLVVETSPIEIDITAIPGGGLLGALLCAIAGLLSGINLQIVLQNLILAVIRALGL